MLLDKKLPEKTMKLPSNLVVNEAVENEVLLNLIHP